MKTRLVLAIVVTFAATASASLAGTQTRSYAPGAYVPGGSSVEVAKAIQARGYSGATGTLTSSYARQAYVPGGSSVQVAKAIQARGSARPPAATSIVSSPNSGSSFNWGDAAIGAAAWTGVLLVFLGGSLLAIRRRGALAH